MGNRPMRKLHAMGQPPANNTVATARWMMSTLWYGALSTISTRTDGVKVGDPFGNPYSHADVDGVPYFYASEQDVSMVDTFAADEPNPRVSFALSEASLAGTSDAQPARLDIDGIWLIDFYGGATIMPPED